MTRSVEKLSAVLQARERDEVSREVVGRVAGYN